MTDENKTRQQLLHELSKVRQQLNDLKDLEKAGKLANEKLRESEERLRSFLASSPEPIIVYDKEGITLYLNAAFIKIFGWSSEELIGRRIPYVPEERTQQAKETLGRLFKGELVQSFDTKRLTKDGRILDIHISSAPFTDKEGNVAGHIVTLRDISDLKKSRDALSLLATAVEQAAEAILITSADGTILYVNPAFERVSGYCREETIGQKPSLLKSGVHDEAFYGQLWKKISQGEAWSGRFLNRRKDGSLYQEDGTISPVRDSNGNIVNYVAVKRDITQEVALEKQLRHAQKMEAVGTLAAGIAHDFNNILQVASGYAGLIALDKSLSDQVRKDVEKIETAGRNGAELVRRLLTFSREVELNARPVNLNHEIEQVKNMLARTIPRMIQIELHLADELETVSADTGQMQQVLVNLAVNAQDSMPDGGTLTIETQNVTLDADYSRRHFGAKPGNYVQITVSDTGHGMEKDTIDHIFEPFFTTKEIGQGTGLGLAIVYGIVKQHGGYIWCYSEPGEGTTFTIYLPAVQQVPKAEVVVEETKPASGSETILVADDDEYIRELAKRMLTLVGYKVITATNGKDAFAIYQTRKSEISLIVLDLIMPEWGGKQCLSELLKIDPQAKIIISSGYSGNITAQTLELGARALLTKPFSARKLCGLVRKVLDT